MEYHPAKRAENKYGSRSCILKQTAAWPATERPAIKDMELQEASAEQAAFASQPIRCPL